MNVFGFPVWVIVNQERHSKDGYPYYILTRGGPPTPLPPTLAVFSTETTAKRFASSVGWPFKEVAVDSEAFREILEEQQNVEDVVLDIGTENAIQYRVEALLVSLRPRPHE